MKLSLKNSASFQVSSFSCFPLFEFTPHKPFGHFQHSNLKSQKAPPFPHFTARNFTKPKFRFESVCKGIAPGGGLSDTRARERAAGGRAF